MKARLFIIALFGLALAACHKAVETRHGTSLQPIASPDLSAIDSLMWQRPDSALAMLLPYFDTSISYDHYYAHLLLAELLYKNDSAQTNRAELQQAVAYFDSLADTPDAAFLAARAHYINGVGYYEQDSLVDACKEYIKALEMMEERFGEKELVGEKARFVAMTYTRLTVLFSDFYLHEQALFFGKEALEYYQKYDATPWHIAWILEKIGSHYDIMDNYDSADFYYHKSLSMLPDTNNLTYRDIATHLTYLSYKKGETSQTALNQLNSLLSKAESSKEYLARCLSIGEIYYLEQQFDSAILYMGLVYDSANSIDSKLFVAKRLQEIHLAKGDTALANSLAIFRSQYAYPGNRYGEQDSKLTALCNEYEKGKQETLQKGKTKMIMKQGEFILAIMLVLTLIMLIFHIAYKKRNEHLKKETENRLDAALQDHEKKLEEKELAIAEERRKAENMLKAKEIQHMAALGKARNTIQHLQEENKKLNEQQKQEQWQPKAPKGEYEALTGEGLCINIRQRLKKMDAFSSFDVKDHASLALSSQELSELIRLMDIHCPDFSRKLKKLYPNLNSKDIQLCRLYLLNLSVLQVAVLLGTDYSSVRKRTNRLKEKIGTEEIFLQLKSTFFEET